MLHLDLPILPQTYSRRFWRFTYDAHCVTAIVNTVPSCFSAVIASTVRRHQRARSSLPRTYRDQPPPSPSAFTAENEMPAGLAEELRFGVVMLTMSMQPTDEQPEAILAVRSVSSVGGGDAGGSIVPLVELDMLCLLLHGVLHADRRWTARYLRLWLGGGAATLVLWETDREGKSQVLRASRARSAESNQHPFWFQDESRLPLKNPSRFLHER